MQAEYLQRHQVISWMQEVLEGLVKEQPDSPWSYVAQKAQQEEEAKQLPLLDQLMKLEAEQEERRRELAALLENQGTRQNTPEEAERQHLMKENQERLEELRFDQMILMEKQRELHGETDVRATLEAKPEELSPFGDYYRKHILKVLPPRLYVGFLDHTTAREAAAAALQVCHPLKLRDEDGDSSVAVSAASRARRGASRSSRRAPSASSGATARETARSSDSTAATGPGESHRGPRISVPKLVLPKRLQDGSDPSGRPLDSRQRKTREALEKLTAVYSVPISRSCPSLCSKGAGAGACEKAETGQEKRPPRPPLPAAPKERLVNKATTEATRVRSEQALGKERRLQRRPDAKLQPLSSNPKKEKGYGPSLGDELRVRGELGKLLSWSK